MFSKSLKDYFKNPVIALPYILFTLIIQILSNLFANPTAMSKLDNISENSAPVEIFKASGPIFLFIFILINISIFLAPVIHGWTYLMSKNAVDGEKPAFLKGFINAWKYYFRLLSAKIIVGLFSLGIIFLFIVFCTPMIISLSSDESLAPAAGIVILSLLLILIILVMSIVFLPLPMLLVYDNLDIDEGFRISFKFGLKKFFPILGPLMLFIFLLLIISIPLGISQAISKTTSPTLSLITSLVGTYLWLFIGVYIMNLYKEEKNKKIRNKPVQNDAIIYTSSPLTEDNSNDDNKSIDSEEEDKNQENNNFIV